MNSPVTQTIARKKALPLQTVLLQPSDHPTAALGPVLEVRFVAAAFLYNLC